MRDFLCYNCCIRSENINWFICWFRFVWPPTSFIALLASAYPILSCNNYIFNNRLCRVSLTSLFRMRASLGSKPKSLWLLLNQKCTQWCHCFTRRTFALVNKMKLNIGTELPKIWGEIIPWSSAHRFLLYKVPTDTPINRRLQFA